MQLTHQLHHSRCPGARTSRRLGVTTVARASTVPPSYATAANELQSLGRLSVIVPDTLGLEAFRSPVKLAAASVSASTLQTVLAGGSLGLKPYENAINVALASSKGNSGSPLASADPLDRAMVNVGAMLTDVVWGRVATEVDPRLANDEDGMVTKARALIALYSALRVPRDRLLIRLPATWAGTQAAHTLEVEGIATSVYAVYGLLQGIAAIQAGASVLQVNVGRVRDWYSAHPGVMLNLAGQTPRLTGLAGAQLGGDPGIAVVKALYGYSRRFHGGKTAIVATGLRSRQDALDLAGVDYLVLNERVMEALAQVATDEGYNDGLTALSSSGGVTQVLSPALAEEMDLQKLPPLSKADWEEDMRQNAPASELLASTLKTGQKDVETLAKLLNERIVGQAA